MGHEVPKFAVVNSAELREGVPVNKHYSIFASPAHLVVTKGAVVRYTLLYDGALTSTQYYLPPGVDYGPGGDVYSWFKFADRSLMKGGDGVPLSPGPWRRPGPATDDDTHLLIRAPYWDCEWDEEPGRYIVGCCIERRGQPKTWCFYAQYIGQVETVTAHLMQEIRKNGGVHPDGVLKQQADYVANMLVDAVRLPPSTPELLKRHQEQLKVQEKYLADLAVKIEPYKDSKFIRIPVGAVHLAAKDQVQTKLNAYLVKVDSQAEYDEIIDGERGWRKVHHPRQEVWMLIDYTIPDRERSISKEATGEGETDEAAIRHALHGWYFTGNRYPEGWVRYRFHFKDILIEDKFETNGRTAWDTLVMGLNLLATAAFVVVGVATLVCPIGGALVISYAMWTGLLSSTAAAGINMAQHMDEGSGTWQDYAIDGLTVVSNVLAGAGQIARTAAAARGAAWGKGAVTALAEESTVAKYTARPGAAWRAAAAESGGAKAAGVAGKAAGSTRTVRMLLIGQMAADGGQGIVMAERYVEEYGKLMDNRDLTPKERIDRLLGLFGRAVMDAGLMYMAFKGNKAEHDALKTENKYLKGEKGGEKGGKDQSGTGVKDDEPTQPGTKTKDDEVTQPGAKKKDDEVTQPNSNPWGDDEVTQPGGPKDGETTQRTANPFEDDDITLPNIEKRPEVLPAEEKIKSAGSKDTEIPIRTTVPAEGHTNPKSKKDKNRSTLHETKARTHMGPNPPKGTPNKLTKEWMLLRDPSIWRHEPRITDTEIRLRRKLPPPLDDESLDVFFFAKVLDGGYLHVDAVKTYRELHPGIEAKARQLAADPVNGLSIRQIEVVDSAGQKVARDAIFVDELNAKKLYEFMFSEFGKSQPIAGIDGHFAWQNLAEMERVLKNPELNKGLILNGEVPYQLHPDALQYSKTWKYWEANTSGYTLVKETLEWYPGIGVFWRFKLVK